MPARKSAFRPQCEPLEARDVPAVFTVTNAAPSGPGSLPDAVAAANADPGADQIVFDTPPSVKTIPVAPLLVADALTVTGPGARRLTLRGGEFTRVFVIAAGADVTITGLLIARGYSITSGGGIFNRGSLTLRDCVLRDNGASEYGGGIVNLGGATLTIQDCVLADNVAGSFGGGVANFGTMTIEDSVVSRNSAAYGGGVSNGRDGDDTASQLTVRRCAFRKNEGIEQGGALSADELVTVSDSIFTSNTSGFGGAISFGYGGVMTITGSQITHNTASVLGGGIGILNATVTVTDCTATANDAPSGGGIHNGVDGLFGDTSTLTVNSSTVTGNGTDDLRNDPGGVATLNLSHVPTVTNLGTLYIDP